ncbi:MAG TPA: hypothetical protein O0X56_01525 [Methanocorpusculum sp.]|nr:hypothetical protein [Methanocorpusculum sp.]
MKYEKVPDSIYEEYPDAYDSQYIIEDELIRKETEADLFCLFDEIDALILDNMPEALVTTPVSLIQRELERKTGLYLTRQEIVDAYLKFAGGYYE